MFVERLIGITVIILVFYLVLKYSIINYCKKEFNELLNNVKRKVSAIEENPFVDKKGKGIVIVAGGDKYGKLAYECVKILRKIGSELPVEIFYLDDDERNANIMNDLCLSIENVSCKKLHFPFKLSKMKYGLCYFESLQRIKGWVGKSLAIAQSSFNEVLLIDADNICLKNPEKLFELSEYKENGVLFWRDLPYSYNDGFKLKIKDKFFVPSIFYKIIPSNRMVLIDSNDKNIYQQESGQLLIDCSRCWKSLLAIIEINKNYHTTYKILWGDKDTYNLGFRLMDQKYEFVKYRPCLLGKMINKKFVGFYIAQRNTKNEIQFLHRSGKVNCKNCNILSVPQENSDIFLHYPPINDIQLFNYTNPLNIKTKINLQDIFSAI